MTCGVYEIVNKETNQSYIGRSINIENRWVGHRSSPTDNMSPTMELYEKYPEMVEWNIIQEIDVSHFDKNELIFITSVCELYELDKRGGWESEDLLNGRDGDIQACPPTILLKRDLMPDCITNEDILAGLEKWTREVYRYKTKWHPRHGKFHKEDENDFLYWYNQFSKLEVENSELKEQIEQLKNNDSYSTNDDSSNFREKMSVDYEYFKLKKENVLLQDKFEELESNRNFWKEKCINWRTKFCNLTERLCKK